MLHRCTLHTSHMKYKCTKSRCRHFWDLWLVKVKVTTQCFLLHLPRTVYIMTYFELLNNGAHINCVITFKSKQTS